MNRDPQIEEEYCPGCWWLLPGHDPDCEYIPALETRFTEDDA